MSKPIKHKNTCKMKTPEKENMKPCGATFGSMERVRFLILFLLLATGFCLPRYDTAIRPGPPKPCKNSVVVTHTGYTLSYNKTWHLADWVAYNLTAMETVPVVKRCNRFVPDPMLAAFTMSTDDYKNSGYDMGHLAAAADMCYSAATMTESFYLSNIAPQVPGFNRGIWKRLEEQVRCWSVGCSAVYVVTGPVFTKGMPAIGHGRIAVPASFYKVIADYREPGAKGIGFIMPNRNVKEPLQHFAVTIDSVERATGIDFFYQWPGGLQRQIESKVDVKRWIWVKTESQ